MDLAKKIQDVQERIANTALDGWLLYDFRHSNSLTCHFLEIPDEAMLTRRFFYWIPREGNPVKITHAIELSPFNHIPGEREVYHSWKGLERILEMLLQGKKKVAMEHSPKGENPYVAKVDGGTVEMIRNFGVDVVSSADLLQVYTSVLDDKQQESHRYAMNVLEKAMAKSWDYIVEALDQGREVTEYDVQETIMGIFENHACETMGAPICAVNEHAADPHYSPTKEGAAVIKEGDLVLIDMWCKQKVPRAVYADISNVAVVADKPTQKQQEVFDIVKEAQDAALKIIFDRYKANKEVMGWEADQEARSVITSYGYGEFFTHRTGHNIGVNDHGDGAHLDNWETHDRRALLKGTLFSVEPGIYLPDEFGIRLECDVFIHQNGQVEVTGGEQDQLLCLRSAVRRR